MYLGDWIARHAEITPDHPAIIDGESGQALSYAALDARVGRLAGGLIGLGVGVGDRVALVAHNATEVFEVLLACARIGAVFVPFNWRLSPVELIAIAGDCAPVAIIADEAFGPLSKTVADAAGIGARVIFGGELSAYEALIDVSPAASTHQVGEGDLSMILYTSGTTGLPKGVMISWRQVIYNAVNTTLACNLGPEDRCLAFLPLFHTGGINCLATPLLHRGGTVVIMKRFDAVEALRIMEAHQISITVAVPAMYKMLLDGGLSEYNLPKLHTFLCGGAPCPHALIEGYLALGYSFRQGYGLTEVGPNCFSLHPSAVRGSIGSVGRPIFHSSARVVADDGAEAGHDEVGELWLKGPHVTLGYWNNAEATAAVLDEQGWFHTGDLVQRAEDGTFRIAGRKKEMFISGGENVYPAEVENALSRHPEIAEVAVIGVPDERWGEVGMAVLVGAGGAAPQADSLAAWTRERLAAYKVPKHWRVVDALPRNPSGKVLKNEVRDGCLDSLRKSE